MPGKRTHVVIPAQLVAEIDALVGKRRRSAFIAEAASQALQRLQLIQALAETEGSWQDAPSVWPMC